MANIENLKEPNNPMTFPAPVPEIPAANVDKAAAYYVNTLGFTLDWGDDQGSCIACTRRQQIPAYATKITGICFQGRSRVRSSPAGLSSAASKSQSGLLK